MSGRGGWVPVVLTRASDGLPYCLNLAAVVSLRREEPKGAERGMITVVELVTGRYDKVRESPKAILCRAAGDPSAKHDVDLDVGCAP